MPSDKETLAALVEAGEKVAAVEAKMRKLGPAGDYKTESDYLHYSALEDVAAANARTDMPRLIAALRVAMRMIANQSKQLTGEALLEWCEREGHDGPPDFEGAYEALVEQANHALARVAAILEAKQ